MGVGVASLEEVCHQGWVLGFQMLELGLLFLSLFLQNPDLDVDLSVPLAPCLPVCHYASYHDNDGLNL